jgi:hypothetical protein
MARRKDVEWISGNEAAAILTKNTDHKVSTAYVRLLASQQKIRSRAVNAREKEYHKGDVSEYIVERRSSKKQEEPEHAA